MDNGYRCEDCLGTGARDCGACGGSGYVRPLTPEQQAAEELDRRARFQRLAMRHDDY